MKKELIHELFEKFEQACYAYNDLECWNTRDLQTILGYAKWDNFYKVIEKAKTACESSGVGISDHFADVGKMVDLGSGSKREIEDVALTRYACYHATSSGPHNVYNVIDDKEFRSIIDNKNFALLNTNPNGEVCFKLTPELRNLTPQYLNENISISNYIA